MQDRRSASSAGLFGKLPARGDFVRLKLPGDFVTAWDEWLANGIAATRARVGEAWLPAYLEAPVWRFALAPGIAGARAATGLFLPSVDRVGRYFPLTFAVMQPTVAAAWLDACEDAGRAALAEDAAPEDLLARLPEPTPQGGAAAPSGTQWWTAGGPRVAPMHLSLPALPDPLQFGEMLGADSAMTAGTET